jgi:hypothetical protein
MSLATKNGQVAKWPFSTSGRLQFGLGHKHLSFMIVD